MKKCDVTLLHFQRILCEKESEEVYILIGLNFGGFAIADLSSLL